MSFKEQAGNIAIGTMVEGLSPPDPALKTADKAEVSIRNRMQFSDLIFQFPTNQSNTVTTQWGLETQRVSFPAYITAFSDNYTPTWTTTQTFGRADPIPTYSNTTRDISITVLIPCFDEEDSNENLKKLNTLIKNLYPSYELLKSGSKVLNSPPLARIKFANLLVNHANPYKGLLGYIKSFSTNMNIETGVFTSTGLLLPRAIGFTISFSPLHETTIGWNNRGEFYGSQNFPYKPKASFSDTIGGPLGARFGLSDIIDLEKLAGWGGE
jgi:hypothetical protein